VGHGGEARVVQKRGRPAEESDKLGLFKYARMKDVEFDFDREAVWLRFGGGRWMNSCEMAMRS
jgi:hypothetical protein